MFSSDMTGAKTSFYKGMLEASAYDPCKLYIFSSLYNPPSFLTADDFVTFFDEKIQI